ncbi:unnamed protein product [Didymodactylos carnosus]|uniref:Uncharacterized protein n=1 Tax=Didymodactylos carnosus TaxID=1234261 RepID=A0A814Z893_9BILA|nr:unnamed protein product [Didymodactylos carnosus]CAF4000647.1 unnamed protein product [Didymodactylos carnosus]
MQVRPANARIQDIIYEYKQRAVKRRGEKLAASHRVVKRKVTEVLMKNTNNQYKCRGCGKYFKPQGITNHVKARPVAKVGVRRTILSVSSNF